MYKDPIPGKLYYVFHLTDFSESFTNFPIGIYMFIEIFYTTTLNPLGLDSNRYVLLNSKGQIQEFDEDYYSLTEVKNETNRNS